MGLPFLFLALVAQFLPTLLSASEPPPRQLAACKTPSEDERKLLPHIASVTPRQGYVRGGNRIRILGSGFREPFSVFIGDQECVGLVRVSPKEVTCVTQSSESAGTADITMMGPEGFCGVLSDGFEFSSGVTIQPKSSIMGAGNRVKFKAVRGRPPYVFALVSGGGMLNPETGEYVASDGPGTGVIRLTDATGESQEAAVVINPPLSVEIKSPSADIGQEVRIGATGGVAPYKIRMLSGPGSIETSEFILVSDKSGKAVLEITDAMGNRAQGEILITEAKAPPEDPLDSVSLTITPQEARIAAGGSVEFRAAGGKTPYRYRILAGGGELDSASGKFVAPARPGLAWIEVLDADGKRTEARVNVVPALMGIPATKEVLIGESTRLSAVGGFPPYRFSLQSGRGQILKDSGTYQAPEETGEERVRIEDSHGSVTEIRIQIVKGSIQARSIALGYEHTCVIYLGRLKCWGDNRRGQLGTGDASIKNWLYPVHVVGIPPGSVSVVAGRQHTCALIAGGVRCWGANDSGQLGDGTKKDSARPVQVLGLTRGVRAIAAGQFHTCAILEGSVLCWGDNRYGQLGNGSYEGSSVPVQTRWITGDARAVSTGSFHSCALLPAGAQCWGQNSSGQVGNGLVTTQKLPQAVKDLATGWDAIESGGFQNCILGDGKTKCWGFNGAGQLGDGTTRNILVPKEVRPLGQAVQQISMGQAHTCALSAGRVYCWGQNPVGQLGDGTTTSRLKPAPVNELTPNVLAIGSNDHHNCALYADTVRCWGKNASGELGNRTRDNSLAPTAPISLK